MEQQIIAVCGKGGVGKTALSALLSRVLIRAGINPLLLIDADPASGLMSAIGERGYETIAGLRDRIIGWARKGDTSQKVSMAEQIDYLMLEVLQERPGYSFLAIGHSSEKGCFCPANTLLRGAIELLAASYSMVLIDAEAGIEHIQRDVIRRVTKIIVVIDGSGRSRDVLNLIKTLVDPSQIFVVLNRHPEMDGKNLSDGIEVIGSIPEDEIVRKFDQENRPLWELPEDNEAFVAVKNIAQTMGLLN